eukprot:448363_1
MMLRRLSNKARNLSFQSIRPFTASLPSFSLFDLNWETESPFYSPSTWISSLKRPFVFANSACYAYYYQIIADLQTYYNMNDEAAHHAIYDRWIYLHLNSDTMDLLDILQTESPFYYATGIALQDDPDWIHKTYTPSNYNFCEEYKMLMASDEYTVDNEEKCIKAFKQCMDDSSDFDKYGSLQSFMDVMTKKGVKGIDVAKGRINLDFNAKNQSAFYVTKYRKQAKLWTIRRAAQEPNAMAVIAQFTLNMDKCKDKYKWRTFSSYHDWAEFVTKGRNGTLEHDSDAVEGPCYANPNDSAHPRPFGHQIAIKSLQLIQNEFTFQGPVSIY